MFWNNFNYYLGAPFKKKKTEISSTDIPFPVGGGIILHGGRGNQVSDNQIFGNWLSGFVMIAAFQLKRATQRPLLNNQITNNDVRPRRNRPQRPRHRLRRRRLRQLLRRQPGVTSTFPPDGSTIVPCTTPPTPNVFDQAARDEGIGWLVATDHEAAWVPHDHAPQAGLTPIEHWPPS